MRHCLALLLACYIGLAHAGEATIGELPPEADATLRLIAQGGPFPYRRDGIVFHNFEKRLPSQARGYYREYTVPTPGIRHRGKRRIVCAGLRLRQPEACYYTADHYQSFRKIIGYPSQ